jgi:hypothetical protein
MKTIWIAFTGIALISFLNGCASTPTALAPVGPNPAGALASVPEGSPGRLQVFSATEKSPPVSSDDFFNYTYPLNLHTGYEITDATGQTVKFVPNHASDLDEWPDNVALPAGVYHLVASSTWCGQVTVPVVVQNGKTTVVHLDNNWWPPANTPANQLVFLPDGETAGWSSSF